MNIERLYKLFQRSTGISTDTRTIKKGDLYFALRGERFDGNTYAIEAIEKGAIASIVASDTKIDHALCIGVEDTLLALQKLATFHRQKFDIPVLAITGSNGKTTTKELINAVLSKKYKVKATKGNLNNHIGVPLTILSWAEDIEFAIVEMGANHMGEIKLLSEITRPNFGLITNIGKAHLEGFGSLEGVRKGKLELADFLENIGGTFFKNMEDPKLSKTAYTNEVPYGASNLEVLSEAPIVIRREEHILKTNLFGSYNLFNISCALKIGEYFDLDFDQIKEGIESYVPTNNRSQIIENPKTKVKVVLDAYNANPSSMELALSSFAHTYENTCVILGSMKEMGAYSAEEHLRIANLCKTLAFNLVLLVGEEFEVAEVSSSVFTFKSTEECKVFVKKMNDLPRNFLIKGSRFHALEQLADIILNETSE